MTRKKHDEQTFLEFASRAERRLHTEPSLAISTLLGCLIAIVFSTVIWSVLGQVDVVVTAYGHIEPATYTRTIQAVRTSRIEHVYVREGDHVSRGQLLVQLDTESDLAELQRASAQLTRDTLAIVRIRTLLTADERGTEPDFPRIGTLSEKLVDDERLRTYDEYDQHMAKLASLKAEIAEKVNEALGASAQIRQSGRQIALLRTEASIRRKSLELGIGSKIEALEIYQRLRQQEDGMPVLWEHVQEAAASRDALAAQSMQAKRDYRTGLWEELQRVQAEKLQLESDVRKARNAISEQALRAPDTGTVQQLDVNTVGGVVTSAQLIMAIVPDAGGLVVNLNVQNKDIGFLKEGQAVALKVDAYPFAQYGTLRGTILHISRDAALRSHLANATDQGSARDPGRGDSDGNDNYIIEVEMPKMQASDGPQAIRLVAGMSVSADIITGRRRILSYFFAPIRETLSESLHER
ncbi:HlyD family type I secretion periplasmic adaptor subunit [Gluconacetobacter diazotrophicus]|uniref:Membrane fusion protein (MFP) family protein n=1 Tax=Gluconacetobacter diazotrophicus TaxID=33996 RepID=A0A7W4I8L7_GLUDI|nr:HlyD family type I secretion periplasmic adaptor subunit [Gluconacetobacter diazotrophicus]MBB2158282.1 HlyD family type I secretion periplasmic adaptor subunit [Gluconacetobacter diazotrophicus]